MKILKLLWIILCISVLSCAKSTVEESTWDEANGKYIFPDLGLTYEVPFDIERWSIANPNNLISKIKFIGVDNENNVMVMVVTPTDIPSKIEDLREQDVKNMVLDIIQPSSPSFLTRFTPSIKKSGSKWYFNSDYSIVEGGDTIDFSNQGTFFSAENQIVGFIIVVANDVKNRMDKNGLQPYIEGLKGRKLNSVK
ncbi:MAG: hypothetical protein K2H86_01260 [Muribaculaceae bacterium]|nr:hypothetical protein [Muribaculaceae bacterium]